MIQGNLPHSESTDLNVNPITKLASESIKIVFDRSSGKSNLTLSLHTFNHHGYLLLSCLHYLDTHLCVQIHASVHIRLFTEEVPFVREEREQQEALVFRVALHFLGQMSSKIIVNAIIFQMK